jgi:Domain of unknown function DUF29
MGAMTGRLMRNEAGLAPSEEPVRANYDSGFYSWSLEQARLVRAGEWTRVDIENVAEEIESLGREQLSKLESAFCVLLMHLLKWDHQPRKRSRSWALSIKTQRIDVEDVLADNPGLKPRIDEAIGRAYRKARIEAARETGLDEPVFPHACPYSFDDIMTREISRE